MSYDSQRAIPEDDPLWQAAKAAPVYDGPVPEQERLDVEAAVASGRFTDGATVTREIEARRAQDDHPALQAFASAPVVPGRASGEEREVFAAAADGPWIPHEELMAEVEERRPRDPEVIARLDASFAAAPPEWQEFFAELDRRDPKMRPAE